MSKKVIGALLAIVMVLSVFSFTVFAAGSTGYDTDASHTQTWRLGDIEGTGPYTIKIYLTTNYNVGPIQFKLENVDSVTAVEVGSGYYTATAYAGSSGLVSIIPDTSSTITAKTLSDAHVATVTYTSASNATPTILASEAKTAANPQGTLFASYAEGSDYVNGCDFLVGQAATIIEVGGDAPVVAAADLQASASGVVIDTSKTFGGAYAGVVYGIPAKDNGATKLTSGDYYQDFVTATNGGSVTVVKSIYSGRAASWGTGTKLEVYNADGTLAKTYIIVLFGDVNGDSLIENTDIGLVLAEAMSPSLPDIQKMAANCYAPSRGTATVIADALYNVDNTDIGLVLQQAMQYDALDFAALAAKHAQYNNYYQ